MTQAFISWSGPQARVKARALRKLLEDVLPEATVFMSDEDISAGSFWLTSISGSLDASVAGVIIVNPENLKNPWLHYEAGALATRVQSRMVIPLMSGVTPSDLASTPLSNFQALELNKSSILEVCLAFAGALEIPKSREALDRVLNRWWSDYENDLLATHVNQAPPPIGLDDLYKLISSLQAQIRSQAELLTTIASRSVPTRPTMPAGVKASSITAADIAKLGQAGAVGSAVPDMFTERQAAGLHTGENFLRASLGIKAADVFTSAKTGSTRNPKGPAA